MIIIDNIKKYLSSIYTFFKELDLNSQFLYLVATISFITLSISIFNPSMIENDTLGTVRSGFASIFGYFLEKVASRKKTIAIGMWSIILLLVLLFSYIFNVSNDNPSLILFQNVFFSLIGSLTSIVNKPKE